MSDTPRTDHFTKKLRNLCDDEFVPIEFARQLERELAAMTRERDFFRDAFNIQGDALSNVINQRDKEAIAAAKGGQP